MTSYVVSTPVNGTFTVPDDQINTSQTSLNLIGRGVTNYGQAVVQNDLNILQNFAGPSQPYKPLIGQLWYNSTAQQLFVYTGPAIWSQIAYESDLANYATLNALNNLSGLVNGLNANVALKSDLANYVTAAELYMPASNSPTVPFAAGGTGLNTLGQPGQMLVVNGLGTSLTYAYPQNYYIRPFISVNQTKTLTSSQTGHIINVAVSGVTISLPPAVQCQQGTSYVFTLLVTGGSITIQANGTDYILAGKAAQATTYTMYAGEELELASDGALGWVAVSNSRTTAVTMPAGDSSLNLANTAFVTSAVNTATSGLTTYLTGNYAPINSPALTGTPTAPTAPVGNNSSQIATTAFATTAATNAANAVKIPFTPVQQGGGASQGNNKVYLGWDGSRLRCQIDATDLGGLITLNELSSNVTNLQNQINTKAPANNPYAYTGINQSVSFWDIYANGTIFSAHDIWAFYSDARLKENIRQIDMPLEKIRKIMGIIYTHNQLASELTGCDTTTEHMGLLAQQLFQVAPMLVGPAPFDIDPKTGKSISGKNYLTIKYDKLVALLVEGIKELDNKVDNMMQILTKLMGDNK
jgi:hypothetical protein